MRDGTISVRTTQQTDPCPRENPEMKRSVAATAWGEVAESKTCREEKEERR